MRNLGQQFIPFRGHDRIRLEPVTILVFPGIPKPREREETAVSKLDRIRLLGGLPFFRPLDKEAGRDQATSFLERLTPSRSFRDRLRSGVDR